MNIKNARMSLEDIAEIVKSDALFFCLTMFKEQKKVLEEKIYERKKQCYRTAITF